MWQHISVTEFGGVTSVEFLYKKILDPEMIREIGDELNQLMANLKTRGGGRVTLVFTRVEFVSSALTNKLVLFDRWAAKNNIPWRMCEVCPAVMSGWTVSRLNQLFRIDETREDSVAKL